MGTVLSVIGGIAALGIAIGVTIYIVKKYNKKPDNNNGNEGNNNNKNDEKEKQIKINNDDDLSDIDKSTINNIDNSRLISDFSEDEQISIIINDNENMLENEDNIIISSKSN